MLSAFYAVLAVFVSKTTFAAAPAEIVFLISTQPGSEYHRQLGVNLHKDILEQSKSLTTDYQIHIGFFHEISNHPGDWTLLNVLSRLHEPNFTPTLINDNTRWIVLVEESTEIKVEPLLSKLSHENHTKPLFLGHPLYDHEATIIHHFAFYENPKWFPYPMLRAGVVLSASLLKSLTAIVTAEGVAIGAMPPRRFTEFSIDAAHELARFIWDNVLIESAMRLEDTVNYINEVDSSKRQRQQHDHGEEITLPSSLEKTLEEGSFRNFRKIILRKASFICPTVEVERNFDSIPEKSEEVTCTMSAKPMDTTIALCPFAIKSEQIFVAIKTCQKFHKERIPIIEATWAQYVIHKRYYSDVEDASIPTISTGVPNAEIGHCEKTLEILKLALKDIEQLNKEMGTSETNNFTIHWLLLSDDDTLLSFSRLCDFLSCFNYTDMIYLGERYGYRLHDKDGFNYITGGGGIVLSLPVVNLIVRYCSCPSATSPDDMILGSCLHMLGVQAIHSSRFHQARPKDYPRELLQLELPISFHKFWQLDPLHVYKRWLTVPDHQRLNLDLVEKPMEQHSKLLTHFKVFREVTNKSQYISNGKGHCESNQDPLNISLASFEHESSSHLDL